VRRIKRENRPLIFTVVDILDRFRGLAWV